MAQKLKRLVLSPANYRQHMAAVTGETVDPISLTVPDQSLTLRQILTRFVPGEPVRGYEPYYSDEDVPDLKRMDMVEIEEYRTRQSNRISDIVASMDVATRELAQRHGVLPQDLRGFPPPPKIEVPEKMETSESEATN